MLSPLHHQAYQDFQQELRQLHVLLPKADGVAIANAITQLNQMFQHRLLTLPTEDLEPATAIKVRSYQTEIHKQLQLLRMDTTLLQAARQSVTRQQRQRQIRDRLQILIRYCQTLIDACTSRET
jgi:hypothetical protein